MKYMLLNDPTNDLLSFRFIKIHFRSSRSDADEDDYGHEFEENSGRSSTLEFDQAVLDISATSLDIRVRSEFISSDIRQVNHHHHHHCVN